MKSSKKYFICLPAFYLIMCLMKSLKNFEKLAIFEMRQLVSFWGVKIHFGEKYAWFAIEILIHGSKNVFFTVIPSNIIKNHLNRYNTDFI